MSSVNEYNYQQIHDRRLAESISVAAIAKVTRFDFEKMVVDVQPLAKHLQNGKYESQPPILSIPVVCTRSGGFIFRPWIAVGDVGVVLYLDHDSDSTVTGGKEAVPSTERNHSTSDAVYLGGIVSGNFVIDGVPGESLVLAKEDGSVYMAVMSDGISIRGNVEIDGAIMARGDVEIEGNVTTTGDVEITGNVAATGDVEVDGTITAAKDVIAESSISGAHHTHPGCSGGTTGQPM